MVSYLTDMERWLCGACLWSSKADCANCQSCGISRDEAKEDGDADVAPQVFGVELSVAEAQAVDIVVDNELPSLEDIFSRFEAPLVEFVPASCRTLWGSVLAEELAKVRTQNTESAWIRLCLLPKCSL